MINYPDDSQNQSKIFKNKVKTASFDFDKIEKYFRNKDNTTCYQTITDRTCNDLDFNDLFIFLDRTHSKVGQQFFYNELRSIKNNEAAFADMEYLVESFRKNDVERNKIASLLKKLDKDEAYQIASLFQDPHISPPKWFWAIKILFLASILSIGLTLYSPKFVVLTIALALSNFVIHYWNKKNIYQYAAAIPQLLRMNNAAKLMVKHDILKKYRSALSGPTSSIDKVRNRMWLFRLEAKLDSDAGLIFWGILEFVKIIFLLEPILLFNVLELLGKKRREAQAVYEFVGYVDTLISIGTIRDEVPFYCLPKFSTRSTINAVDVYHPLIENCVPNSIDCTSGSVLLTGSNMAGKTSFIRSIGINAITAMTINTCFARSLEINRSKVYSSIRISDDLINNKSYYFEEVLTIKRYLKESFGHEPCIFLIDEPFKGTNTLERIAAGKSVLSSLAKNNLVFVTTHDMELARLLQMEYQLFHFCESIDGEHICFDYKLKEGPVRSTNALNILKINGYPTEVIDEAFRIAGKFAHSNLS